MYALHTERANEAAPYKYTMREMFYMEVLLQMTVL